MSASVLAIALPARRRLIHRIDQHDRVVDHDARQHDRADDRHHVDRIRTVTR